MTQEEIDELIALLEGPVNKWGDTDDSELYDDCQNNCNRICELLSKIKPY